MTAPAITASPRRVGEPKHYAPAVLQPRPCGLAAFIDPTQSLNGQATFHLGDLVRIGPGDKTGETWLACDYTYEPEQVTFDSPDEAVRALELAYFAAMDAAKPLTKPMPVIAPEKE